MRVAQSGDAADPGEFKSRRWRLDIVLHRIGRARRIERRDGLRHLIRVGQRRADAADPGDFNWGRRRLDIVLHWIGRARRRGRLERRDGRQHLMRVGHSRAGAADPGDFNWGRRRLDIVLHWIGRARRRDCHGRRGGRQHLTRVGHSGATVLGHCGRLRCGGLDRRSAVENDGTDTNTKTDTNQSGTDQVKRPGQRRQQVGSLRAHSPLPPTVWSKAHAEPGWTGLKRSDFRIEL